jgi:RNA polymerase sigma-70 factor (ECF subfamily)
MAMSVLALGLQLVEAFRLDRTATALQTRVTELFEETREDVYRYLLMLGLQPARAQETVQEVFLRLYTSLKKGEDIQNPRGWIFRVAHNYGLKVRARQGSEDPFDAGMELQLASKMDSPEHELLERERIGQFHRAFEGLSDQQKRCLALRMEGLRYPEIAATLGISASAVGEFLRRAMVRLKKVRNG